jgi:hypothetical protein
MGGFPASCHDLDMGRVAILDRRIRELCDQAVATQDADKLWPIICELRDALREHNDELKLIIAEYPFLLADLVKRAA